MRASFWHWSRTFLCLFLPTTVRATSRSLYRDQPRRIRQDPQIRADRYVRHAEYHFIFTPDRRHPLGLQPSRRFGLLFTAVGAIRKISRATDYKR